MLIRNILFLYFVLMVAFSIAGYFWETALKKIQKSPNRIFFTGPYHPIYGLGVCFTYFICTFPLDSRLKILIISGSVLILEYIGGMIFNKWLKMKLWDYSKKFLNLHGQICLTASVVWILFVTIFVLFIYKPLSSVLTPTVNVYILVVCIIILFIYDTTVGIINKIKKKRACFVKE